MSHIYFIRHGQASFGTDDYDRLSPLGGKQSRLTGEWFKRCGIDIHHSVAGGLKRHIQTAEAFFEGYDGKASGRTIQRDDDFNEVDQLDIMNPTHARGDKPLTSGTGGKLSFEEFRQYYEPAFFRWAGGEFDHEYAESFPAFDSGCTAAIARVLEPLASHETAVVFTSGGTIGIICRKIFGISDQTASDLMWLIGNTSVTRLTVDGARRTISLFNSTAHLDHHGDKTLFTMS